jgi:hypothetical protein
MLFSEPMYKAFRPDLEHPTRQDAELAFPVQQGMPIPCIEPVDISNAVLFLASDEARCITGMQLRMDSAGYLKVARLPPAKSRNALGSAAGGRRGSSSLGQTEGE